jgi:uncharacterized protein (TIGR03066 family)
LRSLVRCAGGGITYHKERTMRAIRWTALVAMVLVLAFTAAPLAAQDKAKDLIVGKWEPVKAPPGAKIVIEFTKDGKVVMTGTANQKDIKLEGKYKFTDDKTMQISFEQGGKAKTDTTKIVKLTKDELVTKDENDKEEQSFKRVK